LTAAVGFKGDLGLSASTVDTLSKAKTGAQVLNAIDKGNPIALANALMQTDTGKELMGQDMGGGIKLGDVVNTAKVAQLVNTGNYAEALATVGQMTNSPNLKLSASAVNLATAIQSGDPFKIITAAGQMDRAVKSADAAAKKEDAGGIQNRVVDDTISQGDGTTDALSNAGLTEEVPGASDLDRILNLAGSGTQVAGGDSGLGLAKTVTGGLAPKEGESTTGVTRKVEEGFTVYESIISGEDAEGNPYSYKATYDPNAPYGKQYYYQVLGGSKPGFDVDVVASTTRPDFTQALSEIGGAKSGEGAVGSPISDDYLKEVLDLIGQTGGSGKPQKENIDLTKLSGLLGGTSGGEAGGNTGAVSGGASGAGSGAGTGEGGVAGTGTGTGTGAGDGTGTGTGTGDGAGTGTGTGSGTGTGTGGGDGGGAGTGDGTGTGDGEGEGEGDGDDEGEGEGDDETTTCPVGFHLENGVCVPDVVTPPPPPQPASTTTTCAAPPPTTAYSAEPPWQARTSPARRPCSSPTV
jgi:hypothetical protein